MQDRISQIDKNLLHHTAGPYIWVKLDPGGRGDLPVDVCNTPNIDRKLNTSAPVALCE